MLVPGSASPLLFHAPDGGGGGGYEVSRSLRFNSADSASLSKTFGSTGNRKTWSLSLWCKRSKIGGAELLLTRAGNPENTIRFNGDALELFQFSGGFTWQLVTSQLFRDPSAWYHILIVFDTTQATSSNRVKLYVNGTQVTAFSTASYPSLNFDGEINTNTAHEIGVGQFNGYLAEVFFIDGQALTPTSFGEFDTNGVWQPKAYSGSFGTNGFWLKFSDNSAATATTLGKDYSGNSNNWTPNNLSVTAGAGNDSLRDSPTNGSQTDTGVGGEVVGNYATWNPLDKDSDVTLSNGNLDTTQSAPGAAKGTIAVSTGKWYWEITKASTGNQNFGIATIDAVPSTYVGGFTSSAGFNSVNGDLLVTGSVFSTVNGSTIGTTNNGDVLGLALDLDGGTLKIYRNGTLLTANHFTISNARNVTPAIGTNVSLTGSDSVNFGARSFAYTAPSGFKALCTANLPTPTITNPSTVMDVKLYTGNGSTQTISGLGFSPDLVWIKRRSVNANHNFFDTVRGATKVIKSDATDAEVTASTALTAFNSDGFTVGSDGDVNGNTHPIVAWAWDAGTSNATNTNGTITSTVRANISAGLSIITFIAPSSNQNFTVGHGLGMAPAFTILKRRDSSTGGSWWTWHIGLGDNTTDYLALNQTSAENSLTAMWGATGRTSSLLGFSTPNSIVASGTYVVYAFAPVAGYSAFGSYVGNGSSTDGPFVYTGFKPRFLLIKGSSVANTDWAIIDTARDTYNIATDYLAANSSGAEQTLNLLDVVSNGFKIKAYTDSTNQNNQTYVWAAFAEHPFALARAR